MKVRPGKSAPADCRELVEIDGIWSLALLYLCVNIVAACAFAWDKHLAKKNTWRTSENTLLVLAFLGPFGAFGAMRLVRHKTQKIKFWLVPLFLLIHLAVFAWLLLKFR
jgi:uncharacterized membrane protein YsdA (DUF1294 family)